MTQMTCYFTGGTGMNIGAVFAKWNGKENPGFATLKTVYADTSDRNKTEEIPESMFYTIMNLDGTEALKGGGKVRKTNAAAIEQAADEILARFQPTDINIVVHSGGGGSGSVIGPVLAREITSRGGLVISLVVETIGSSTELENDLNTLATYQNFVDMLEQPFSIFYRENTPEKPREKVNEEMVTAITILSSMFSGQNRELDQEDCRNFLNYHIPTEQAPRLGFLDLFAGKVELQKGDFLASLLTLTEDGVPYDSPIMTDYHATGYINPVAVKAMRERPMPLQAAIIFGRISTLETALKRKIADYDKNRSLVVDKGVTGSKKATKTTGGLAL